jgi:hypothetical protein
MFKKIMAFWTAFQAGRIAHNCPLCIVDDEKEEIIPCHQHAEEIGRLHARNEKFNG